MAIPCFYAAKLRLDDRLNVLDDSEARHAIRSRRLRSGDKVKLINGRGLIASGVLDASSAEVKIDNCSQVRRKSRLAIAAPLAKGDRQRFMIDTLAQLGVACYLPLKCERAVSKYSSAKLARWKRIAIEAAKQSHNPWLLECGVESSIAELLQRESSVYFAERGAAQFIEVVKGIHDVVVLIGPEGGLSETEVDLLKAHNARAVGLSKHTLRIETAAVVAASMFALSN